MKELQKLAILFCTSIAPVASMADTPTIPAPQPAQPTKPVNPEREKEVPVVLDDQYKGPRFRAPSRNPIGVIDGIYNQSGTLSLNLAEEAIWELTITSFAGTATYTVSTSELACGVNIGQLSEFTITLTNDLGASYFGEVYID